VAAVASIAAGSARADQLAPDELAHKKDGGYITGLPLAAYSTDIGLGLGARAYYYWDGHPDDPRFAQTPYLYRSTHPAWNDRNLRELSAAVSSPLFFAHIRAATGTAIQETNTHPFRYGRWLWMHNGLVREFAKMRRELVLAVDDSLFDSIEGTTDSEVLFYLALTFGLEDDPVEALERTVGLIEETGRRHGIDDPIQMTVATTDGQTIWAFRYSSEHDSRTLYFSTRMDSLKALYPELVELADLSDETRIVVSEPLGDLPGAWHEVPESHVGIVRPGEDELRPFSPRSD
jgi:glutamine amidotransferase